MLTLAREQGRIQDFTKGLGGGVLDPQYEKWGGGGGGGGCCLL